MIDFEEEIKKFKPCLEVEDAVNLPQIHKHLPLWQTLMPSGIKVCQRGRCSGIHKDNIIR